MVGIVIQGPTNYCKKICEHYSNLIADNCKIVWSTWDGEDQNNIDYITNFGIYVIQSPEPKISGWLNINYQLKSTYEGIKFIKQLGADTIIKVRGDIRWEGIEKCFDYFSNKKISFLGLNNGGSVGKSYFLDYTHNHFDFTVDHVIAGSIKHMEKTFNFQVDSEGLEIPPESLILHSYLKEFSTNTSFEPSNLKKSGVDLFWEHSNNEKNKIVWLKLNCDLITYITNNKGLIPPHHTKI
tara:strand:+ start:2162 stop:2878 length:717 start_codon:yes stop_codon:yes gene_type:complete